MTKLRRMRSHLQFTDKYAQTSRSYGRQHVPKKKHTHAGYTDDVHWKVAFAFIILNALHIHSMHTTLLAS